MSYNVAITLADMPAADPAAWAEVDAAIDAQGPVPPVFAELLARLTAT